MGSLSAALYLPAHAGIDGLPVLRLTSYFLYFAWRRHLAVMSHSLPMVEEVLSWAPLLAGSPPPADGQRGSSSVADRQQGGSSCMRRALGSWDAPDADGLTPLHVAVVADNGR